ncbi:MAG: transcription antitermination factor NusB [Proteobacteria bacterium]|nr:transcription antitermination factor NusB [Pseudomonadota bacterium]
MSFNTNTLARDTVVQYLYQCESEKLFYFSESQFEHFIEHFSIDSRAKKYAAYLAAGVLEDVTMLDDLITKHSKNWSVSRMAITDRVILRMACWELLERKEPPKAVINESIDLAKKYGTEHSGSFVNGIIDSVRQAIGVGTV